MKRTRRQRADSSNSPFTRRLRVELLEDRRLLAMGDLLQTLADPSELAQDYSHFGYSVAVDGPYTVVGTPDANLSGCHWSGVAYVYNTGTGALVATLNNPTPDARDQFGWSVAVSGSTVVVGAPYDFTATTWTGSAYVFDAASGNLLWTLNKPTPAAGGSFGYSVAVSGSTIVVGNINDGTGASDAGSAYVFDAASGNLLRTLNNPAPAAGDNFGSSVAISGDTIVVGAYKDDAVATDDGSAYVFDAATGNLLWTLNNSAPVTNGWFGFSVAISGSTIVVGAPYRIIGMAGSGSADVFNAANGDLPSSSTAWSVPALPMSSTPPTATCCGP